MKIADAYTVIVTDKLNLTLTTQPLVSGPGGVGHGPYPTNRCAFP